MAIRLNYTADAINNLLGKMDKIKGDETTVTLSQNGVLSLKSLPIDNTTLQFSGSTLQINETWLNDKIAEVVGAQKPTLQSISLTASNQSLTVGQTLQLGVIPNPSSYPVSGVQWTSSNTAFATVVNGMVTAIAPGTARITATMEGKQAICDINVAAASIPVESVSFAQSTVEGFKDDVVTLKASVSPSNASDKTVVFESMDTSKIVLKTQTAAQKAANEVECILSGVGTAQVRAICGTKYSYCNVTVKSTIIGVSSVTVTPSTFTGNARATQQLSVVVSPSNATEKDNITFESSNPDAVSVSNTGLITLHQSGKTARITVTCGGVKGYCDVTVNHPAIYLYLGNIEVGEATGSAFTSSADIEDFVRHLSDGDITSRIAPTSATDGVYLYDKTSELLNGDICTTKDGMYNIRAICLPMSMYEEGYRPIRVDGVGVELETLAAATRTTFPVNGELMSYNGNSYYVFGTFYKDKNTDFSMKFKIIKK